MSDHEDETITAKNAPPKNVPQITTVTNISAKFPYLKKGEYDIWAMKMQNFISSSDLLCWNIVLKGNSAKSMTTDTNDEHMGDFYHMIDDRDIWNAIKARFGGNSESKKVQKFATAVVSLHSETEYAFMGLSSVVSIPVTCPLCYDSKYKLIKKDYQGQREQLNDCVVDLKAHKHAVKILEKQIKCHQKNQLAYEEKIRVLSYKLEEKSNILEYKQKLIDQAAQEKQELMTKLDNEIGNQSKWDNSGRNLYKLIESSMSVRTKRGLGLDRYIGEEKMGIDDSVFSIFHTNSDDLEGKPIYNSQECSRPNHSDHDSNDSISSVSAPTSESSDTIVIDCARQEDFPSVCPSSIETDVKSSKTLCNKFGKFGSFNKGSHFRKHKSCYVCDSYLHLIKDCDLHEKRLVKRHAKGKGILRRRPTGKTVNPNKPKPVSAGKPKPVSAGKPKPVSAGKPKPVSAGKPKPVFAGRPKPVSAGRPKTVSGGCLKPVSAGQPKQIFAGAGILGPRPLPLQPTCTYFHSFTHNNQQIIFPITHNLPYSLYMTGGLNGETAVKLSAGWSWTNYGMSQTAGSKINDGSKSKSWSYAKGPLGRPKWDSRMFMVLQVSHPNVAVDTSCCSTLNPHTALMTIYYWKLDNKQVIIQFRGGLLGIVIPAARAFCFCYQVSISAGDLFLLKLIEKLQLIINDEDFFI
nr:hypothetical protein [Tanacetum cinerariifolium]